jgi:predicted metalloprotease with PDZ domain
MPHKKTTDGTIFFAKNFHDLADSPFFITSRLHHIQYQSFETNFHIWIKGAGEFPLEKIETDFKKFTETQIQIFGEFPEEDFHFMLWLSPEASYHGVEHSRSTMMTLGPTTENFDDLYTDLLGLASHELFHAWNIKRIRPKELLPYDYSKENYFTTCFVAEGITTFYGDWILYRSGVFDRKAYHKELESTLRRHFETADQADLSLLESSYDLWLDGYKRGVPERKVSVYHKGATAGLILNHLISEKTNGQQNLDDLMKLLWNRHGKPFIGYSYNDFRLATEEIAGQSFEWYFKTIIESNLSIFETCNEALKGDNFELRRNENGFIQLIDLSPS